MRVLITGIDGFVGSHLAELLVSTGEVEVHGTVLDPERIANIAHLKDSLVLHPADITDRALINSLFQEVRPERVLHLAGQAFVPASLQNPIETFQANLFGGLSILEAARLQLIDEGRSPAVLVVTSGEVYGHPATSQLPVTEALPFAPNTPYATSKASLDMIAQEYSKTFKVDVTIVRPFNHTGPRQSPAFVVSDFAKQFAEIALGRQEPALHVGNISAKRDFTDVRDVVRAYWSLFDRTSRDIAFNVASGKAIEVREILMMLQEISGISAQIVQERDRIRPYDTPVVLASFERLHNATGWSPRIPFRQTLRDTYTYWRDVVRASLLKEAATPS